MARPKRLLSVYLSIPALIVVLLLAGCAGTTATQPTALAVASATATTQPTASPAPTATVASWSESCCMPTPRSEMDAAALGELIYVAGGYGPEGKASAAFEAYDPRDDS